MALIRNLTGSNDLQQMNGLIIRAPVLVTSLAFCLLSLLGLPPLAGFAAKFQVFALLFEAGRQHQAVFPTLAYTYYGLLAVAAFNTVVSAAYYLRILRVMVLDPPPEPIETEPPPRRAAGVYSVVIAGLVLALGIFWAPLLDASRRAAASFEPAPSRISSSL